ncbi:MAG: sigma-54-dependent Fis family transcriptional regulator [Gemmatimonadetes bacterium]|uniref:Sigma-54-dependent Fis family transcriptional regulator n=1 Tax=Candidatus Kutchimonas denitrificans TaxID=3056748 RepID=A0AAE4Z951_9BACT|nr:sigma-54-dependent Fis family transcriptional regulator [Gemmatimonadota bacterium]NIR73766.1 sigma-54-dependent Fis family transcriptional regulator [Candidatus Kutchimonas denitrificans]NIS03130.1 sigma-54-dependent Fis family transcriptional regulator [Gemmatimonadota bacterium]NIT69031.1 sigma-54-dependent Fis family transcriptional regulator [Gemmatimonadota bacterium]NIU54122.1 response regulator [Gemmatimonadota bacterium]
MKVLVVDDEAGVRRTLSMILEDEGYQVISASDGREGLEKAAKEEPDLILCDIRMPRMDGLEFLEEYRKRNGEALVITITAYGSNELAVEAMQKGAYDYLPKPFTTAEVVLTLRKAEEREKLRREVKRLRQRVKADQRFPEIVAKSAGMREAVELATKVAQHPSTVLITGESGTGKELIARLIHGASPRSDRPFVPINCGAIPENLLESELFGHVKGAFTGAHTDRAGLFEEADGGTLFLDEIGELPSQLQVKLLRALQEGEIRRVGDSASRKVDVRLVCATARDLEQEVREGNFRSDLYYRINVVRIHLPPLRQRTEDIPPLTRYFIERFSKQLGINVNNFEPAAMKPLLAHPWYGNVRQLENVVERAMVLAEGPTIRPEDLPDFIRHPEASVEGPNEAFPADELSIKKQTADLERRLIGRALQVTDGNRTKAAELLDLSYRALLYKIRDYGLD